MIHCGDCLNAMRGMEPHSVDALVTDPPYGLEFMGKEWDHGIPGAPFWAEALRVAKPGCHLLAFGGTRTFHRLACAIEDAGWEIRDCLMWVYGSGFPKSHDVSKAIDKTAGVERDDLGPSAYAARRSPGRAIEPDGLGKRNSVDSRRLTASATDVARQWEGWGTALKPAYEPIILARKPLEGTVAENVQKWGTGAINVDGCRIPTNGDNANARRDKGNIQDKARTSQVISTLPGTSWNGDKGRWPANLIHDGSEEVLELFPETKSGKNRSEFKHMKNQWLGESEYYPWLNYGDSGSAARFFMTCKRDDDNDWFQSLWHELLHNVQDGKLSIGDCYRIKSDLAQRLLSRSGSSAARFFYCAKSSRAEREMGCEGMEEKEAGRGTSRRCASCGKPIVGLTQTSKCDCDNRVEQHTRNRNHHPTVKPLALMRYLCRLVTPPNGLILDPFMGSGTTGMAAKLEGFRFIGIEKEAEYCEIAKRRIEATERKPLTSAYIAPIL